jgi:phage baseplate assembly protein gpV
MKRILLSLAVGVALFAIVAFAAWLPVSSGGLQSGSDSVVCDANGVDVKYQNTDVDSDYDQATLYGVDCPGTLDVTVEVQNSGGGTLAYGVVSSSGATIIVPFSDALAQADIAAADHVIVTLVSTGP